MRYSAELSLGSPGFNVSLAGSASAPRDLVRNLDAILRDHGARIRQRGAVADRRPRADGIRVITGHIGDRQRDQTRRIDGCGQLAALDA